MKRDVEFYVIVSPHHRWHGDVGAVRFARRKPRRVREGEVVFPVRLSIDTAWMEREAPRADAAVAAPQPPRASA